MMANYDPKLDAAFGGPPEGVAQPATQDGPAAPARPAAKLAGDQPAKRTIGALDFDALGAKAYQAATFGFGADLDRVLFGKQAEQATRQLANLYDQQHPLAAFGVDLAMAAAESAILPGAGKAQVAKSGAAMLGRQVAGGAAAGAAMGAGAGGDASTRMKRAAEGAVEGTVAALGLGAAGAVLRPLLDRLGPAGFNQVKAAADKIKRALATEGKTPQQLASFLQSNPGARVVDFSPKVADLVTKAADVSNSTSRRLAESLRTDAEGQASRLYNPSQPLQHIKQQLADNLENLQKLTAKEYRSAYAEVTPLTTELKAALDHPDVKPLVNEVLADYQKLRMNPNSAPAQAPKYKVGKEIPTAVIDDLQKRVSRAASDKDAIGTMKAGGLQAAHAALKDAQPASLDVAQRLAATVGGEASETGILGAQQWGAQFAFGMKGAPIEQWRAMNLLQREYARIGMTDGLERYLREHPRMPEGMLNKIGDKMNDPQIREVLGDRTANQIKKAFRTEAARARVSDQMARGGSRRAAFEEENTERIVGHGLNVVGGGAIGSWLRLAKAKSLTEPQAQQIIDIATKPGGMQRLRTAGLDKNLLDSLATAMRNQGFVAGTMTQQGRPQITED
ncbi:hypothetical protein KPA93_25115 [Burkholderia cenocepacia]|uniref:hypothetical protein n=1 Tax=Burkholderia cenocepacia TaxID=95486 RepID=UPI00285FD28B|nr:hypothetical protein [Burkholderia cenocepacia]MDR8026506.1 hypothetical protein [Burkholderia cenocepacia]MDR8043760.1 hypothetical protein [Burkholderia cenocepacia]